MSCTIEELVKAIARLEQEKGQLIMEKSALVGRIHLLELRMVRMVKGQARKPRPGRHKGKPEELFHG